MQSFVNDRSGREYNNMTNTIGDSGFSENYRNPGNLVGSTPNEVVPSNSAMLKLVKIAEQRERILESFMAEHAGILPSQIKQVVTQLDNGDIAWHVERIR